MTHLRQVFVSTVQLGAMSGCTQNPVAASPKNAIFSMFNAQSDVAAYHAIRADRIIRRANVRMNKD